MSTFKQNNLTEKSTSQGQKGTDRATLEKTLKPAILEGTPSDVVERYMSLPQLASEEDFGEYDVNIVVIDTETTGVSFKKDELTQIAAARLDHGQITDTFNTFVNPGMPIPEEITHLTNITDEDTADAPEPNEALSKLVEFVGDAKLVAHNVSFDKHFVTNHPAGYPLLENQWIDSLELSRIALPRMKSHRLIDLVMAFGAPLSTHRADDDVVATCALYRILLAGVASMPANLLSEIARYSSDEIWPTGKIFTFFSERANKTTREARSKEKAFGEADMLFDSLQIFSLNEIRQQRAEACFSSEENMQKLPVKLDADKLLTIEQASSNTKHGIHNTQNSETNTEEEQALSFPTDDEISNAFSDNGLMNHLYPDYEQRGAQLEMALSVNNAFRSSKNLAIEAGTGTGKSMAYLVPSALLAYKNNIGVGIATKTNALLDQLIYKELPVLSKGLYETNATDRPLLYVPLKGFVHYPCLLKVQRIQHAGPKITTIGSDEFPQAPVLAALLSFIEQTDYDDIDSLKIDYRVLPRAAITSSSSECLRKRCPFYGTQCFVFGRRLQAQYADIVVTNHSLLFQDAVMDNSLLPPIRYWIVDEAHSVEEGARKALASTLSINNLKQTAYKLTSSEARTNALIWASRATISGQELLERLCTKGLSCAKEFETELNEFIEATKGLLFYDPQKKSSYDIFDLWVNDKIRSSSHFENVAESAKKMLSRMEKLVNTLQEIVVLLDDEESAQAPQRALASTALELKDYIKSVDKIFIHSDDANVYSATLNRHEIKGRNHSGGNGFKAEPYSVGPPFNETLYANTRSVVYASATLTVNGKFDSFEDAIGLNAEPQSQANTVKLEPCFDFDEKMEIYIVRDMPAPNEASYLKSLQNFLREVHVAQGGSTLTLFTNKREMEKCFDEVSPYLLEHGLRLMLQRYGTSVKGLRDEFLKDEAVSLFALKSFWEGFDAPGNTLRSVVVPKLPFTSPNDPLSNERKQREDNAWTKYDLTHAVIELRQAAGRLIRKESDSGTLILCDSRLITKGYGKVFINSLPSTNVKVLTADEVCEKLKLCRG